MALFIRAVLSTDTNEVKKNFDWKGLDGREQIGGYLCAKGNINIETDGDRWHASPERAAEDNVRDNNIKTAGWQVLRFNGVQIREQMQEYCLPTIKENINLLGGVDEGGIIPRVIDSNQLTLFDE